MSPNDKDKRAMNAQEYLVYLRRRFKQDVIAKRLSDRLDAQMKREGKPFVSFDGTCTSGAEVVAEELERPDRIYNCLVAILTGTDLSLSPKPILGYLPIRNLNAVSTIAPNGERIMLLDQWLRIALHTFTSFLVYLGVETNKRGGLSEVPEDLRLTCWKAVSSSIRFFLQDKEAWGDHTEAWQWMLHKVPPEIPETGDVLCDTLILFIIAHEYAHHFLGHINPSTMQQCEISEGQPLLELAVVSQAKERAADQLALQIFLKCHQPHSDLMSFRHVEEFVYAPLLFFDIVSTVEATRRFSERKIRLHPPALERRQLLLGHVMPLLDERRRANYEFHALVLEMTRQTIVSRGL